MSIPVLRRQVLVGAAAAGLTATGASTPVSARGSNSSPPPRSTSSSDPTDGGIDPDELETFLDHEIESGLEDHDIPGATVSVVQGGEILCAKGYGYANIEDETPVVADETRFRIGSISKLFTYTAAMQLVEQGAIDPHEDVSSALESVSIPGTNDDPITLAHLATHTAGFEERARGTWVDGEARPLETVLREERPALVRPPGEVVAYSNYGAALAGGLVADVAGKSFDTFVQESIFDPLGMDRSTFEQPVTDDLVTGYLIFAGTHDPVDFETLEYAPAGAMSATATDVARFMLAHLGHSIDGERLLEPETRSAMQETWFTHHDRLDGVAFGFFEEHRSGVRVLRHDGATPTIQSDLVLVPEADLGLFVSFNGNTAAGARSSLLEAFFERYLEDEGAENGGDGTPLESDGLPERAADLEGTYRSVRVAETTYEKLPTVAQAPRVAVRIENDSTLLTNGSGETTRWVEEETLLFREVDGDRRLAFLEDESGSIAYLCLGFQAFAPLSRHEESSVQLALGAVAGLALLSGVVGWPLEKGWRRYREEPRLEGDQRRSRWVAGGTIACFLGFVAIALILLVLNPITFLGDPPLTFRLSFLLPIAGTIGTLGAVGYAVRAWTEGDWGPFARVHYTFVVVGLVVLCWLCYYWNLFGLPV